MNNYYLTFRGLPYECQNSGSADMFQSALEFIMEQAGFTPIGWGGMDSPVSDLTQLRAFRFDGEAGYEEAKRVVTEWVSVFGGMKAVKFGGTSAGGLMRVDTL